MNTIPYKQTFILQQDLENVECWNFTGESRHTIPEGTEVTLEHASSKTETLVKTAGLPLINDGVEKTGYRFIVPNTQLGEAIDVYLPAETEDLVGDIMRFEEGEMDEDEIHAFLTRLRDTGTLFHLQGSYQRAAARLGII